MNWFQKLFPRKTKTPEPLPKPVRSGYTLEAWQKSDALVTWARTSQEFNLVLAIARNHQPSGFPLRGQAVTDIQCAVELGRKEGYADLENVLLALRQFPAKVKDEIPADYDDTDYAKEEAQ